MEVSKLIIPSNGEQVTVTIKDATARAAIAEIDGISPSDVTDKDATLSWGTKTEIATIGEQSIHVTLPSNPDTNAVTSVSGKTGVVTLDKSDVGLGNVTNDSQVKRSEMGVANGVATLDANGKVPASQLPSYVDDVIEGYYHEGTFYEEAAHTTAITPETGKIYIDLSTNKSYRWGGSTMVEIAGGGGSVKGSITVSLVALKNGSQIAASLLNGTTITLTNTTRSTQVDTEQWAGQDITFDELTPLENYRVSVTNPDSNSWSIETLYQDITSLGIQTNESISFEFNYINISEATVTASDQTYTGSALTPSVTVTFGGETLTSDDYDVAYSNNTNVGEATITVTGKGDYKGTATGHFSISKAAATYTSPAAQTLTYTGSAQNLLSAGSTNHGTIQYSSDNATWSTTIPQGTNAGSYTAYWKLVGDSNHTDVDAQELSVSIAKADRTISFTTSPSTVTIGETITVVATPSAGASDGTITYTSSDTAKATVSGDIITGIAEGTTTITATVSAGSNYNSATTSYSLSVEPAGTTYNLVVTDNQSGASNAATNANVTVKYTKDNVQTILGTTYKNGNTFLIPSGATNITVTGSASFGSYTDKNFAPTTTVSGTTYTVTYKAQKVSISSNSSTTITLTNTTKGQTVSSVTGTSTNGYVAWGNSWSVSAPTTTSKYPSISPSTGTANSASKSVSITMTSYTLITSGAADLGLPSGKLWSAVNVGASNYYSEGLYFSWGDITGHAKNSGYNFSSTNYPNGTSGSGHNLTADFASGDATYDGARANMGGAWRTPTYDELNELINNCTWIWTTLNSTNGYLVIKNAKAIFLPAAGCYYETSLSSPGSSGHYWSTRYYSSGRAYPLNFNSSDKNMNSSFRYYGFSVRAIKDPEAVDMGSGVKWATGNLTKDSSGNYSIAPATDYGAYFSWGNTEGHRVAGQTDSYSFDSTTYSSTTGNNLTADFTSGSTIYDAARVRLGSPWRIPTYDELNWLKNNCTWTWKASGNTDYNGVAGYEVVGTNSNKIFLPCAGFYYWTSLYDSGSFGNYWSTKYNSSTYAYFLYFSSSIKNMSSDYRYYGRSIRPVQ